MTVGCGVQYSYVAVTSVALSKSLTVYLSFGKSRRENVAWAIYVTLIVEPNPLTRCLLDNKLDVI